jgi:hypothetical protein
MGTHDGTSFALSEISLQPANPVTRFIYNTHSPFFDASLCASCRLQCLHDVPSCDCGRTLPLTTSIMPQAPTRTNMIILIIFGT